MTAKREAKELVGIAAVVVIAFTIGPSAMFVALGGAFLAGSISVLLSGTSPLLALVIVWGVIGVAFLAIGLSGLRSDRRAAADDRVELLG